MIHRTKLAGLKSVSASGVLRDQRIPMKSKGNFYKILRELQCLEAGAECWAIKKQVQKIECSTVAEMRMRW